MDSIKGQITIVDLTDSRQLVAYIATTNRRQVIYDPTTDEYSPDYASSPITLEPELYIAGGGSNIINNVKSVTWTVQTNSTGRFEPIISDATYQIGTNKQLVISSNVLKDRISMLYRVEIIYTDPQSGKDIIIQADMELVRLENGYKGSDGLDGLDGKDGQDAYILVLETPDGTSIRNSDGTVRIVTDLYKGASRVTPTNYKWYKRMPGASGDSESGTGWSRLTSSNNYGTTGYNTATLTVPPQAITGHATYMVITTYDGRTFRNHTSLDDITDPYSVSVLGDNFFKNGQGTNTYLAKIYQGGQEIDLAGNLTYTWHQYSSTGSKVVGFEKVGKEIEVTSEEFSGKGELRVTVTK